MWLVPLPSGDILDNIYYNISHTFSRTGNCRTGLASEMPKQMRLRQVMPSAVYKAQPILDQWKRKIYCLHHGFQRVLSIDSCWFHNLITYSHVIWYICYQFAQSHSPILVIFADDRSVMTAPKHENLDQRASAARIGLFTLLVKSVAIVDQVALGIGRVPEATAGIRHQHLITESCFKHVLKFPQMGKVWGSSPNIKVLWL